MLKKIKGKIVSIEEENISIEVGPFTLEAFPSFRILKELDLEQEYNFEASFEMSEWNIALYLFKDIEERNVFESLKKVSKIGPKTAARIVKSTDAEAISAMIGSGDISGLSKLPGIGKKTAERITSELKGKFEGVEIKNDLSDAIEALEALGYERFKIMRFLKNNDVSTLPVEEIIKIGLAKLSKK